MFRSRASYALVLILRMRNYTLKCTLFLGTGMYVGKIKNNKEKKTPTQSLKLGNNKSHCGQVIRCLVECTVHK